MSSLMRSGASFLGSVQYLWEEGEGGGMGETLKNSIFFLDPP